MLPQSTSSLFSKAVVISTAGSGMTHQFSPYLDKVAFLFEDIGQKMWRGFSLGPNTVKHMSGLLGLQFASGCAECRVPRGKGALHSLINPLCRCDKRSLLKQSEETPFAHIKDFVLQ